MKTKLFLGFLILFFFATFAIPIANCPKDIQQKQIPVKVIERYVFVPEEHEAISRDSLHPDYLPVWQRANGDLQIDMEYYK